VSRAVGEGDKLYGSVTSRDIAEALAEQGIKVDSKKIQLDEPLRNLGMSEVHQAGARHGGQNQSLGGQEGTIVVRTPSPALFLSDLCVLCALCGELASLFHHRGHRAEQFVSGSASSRPIGVEWFPMADSLAEGSSSGRLPPHNLEAERSALGGVLVKPLAFDEMATVLTADDFLLPAHRESLPQ